MKADPPAFPARLLGRRPGPQPSELPSCSNPGQHFGPIEQRLCSSKCCLRSESCTHFKSSKAGILHAIQVFRVRRTVRTLHKKLGRVLLPHICFSTCQPIQNRAPRQLLHFEVQKGVIRNGVHIESTWEYGCREMVGNAYAIRVSVSVMTSLAVSAKKPLFLKNLPIGCANSDLF